MSTPDRPDDDPTPRAAVAPSQEGHLFGDYRILRELGRGGMGIVYEALQETLGRRVALKVLSATATRGPADIERFHREARAAGRLHHTNIVPVFGITEHGGVPGIVMQLIEGRRLDQLAPDLGSAVPALATPSADSVDGASQASSPGSRFRAAAAIALQVAEALAHAHARGVLHRDVKPSNILLDTSGRAWVTDFGLAKTDEDFDLTHTGDVVGTIRYLAPERFRGTSDARSDIYGLGLTLYELITGRPAFQSTDHHQLIHDVIHRPLPRLRTVEPDTPRDLEMIVAKACAHEPDARYRSAAAFADDLRCFLAGVPVSARRPALHETFARWCRRSPGVAALSIAVVALLGVIAIGATLAAFRLDGALQRTQAAEKAAKSSLFDSLLAETRAIRTSPFQGHRTQPLASIARARQLASELGSQREMGELLRDEALASLGRLDLIPGSGASIPWGKHDVLDPRGRLAARLQSDGTVVVREHVSGAELAHLPSVTKTGAVDAIVFSADGRRLGIYVGSMKAPQISIWDVATAQSLLPGGRVVGNAVALSPDGTMAALAHGSYGLSVVDLDTGAERSRVPAARVKERSCVSFSPDGSRLASCDAEFSKVDIRDARTGKLEIELSPEHWDGEPRTCVLEWSADGRRLATARWTALEVFDIASRESVSTFTGHQDSIRRILFDASGELLFSSAYDGDTALWDIGTGKRLVSTFGLRLVGFDESGKLLLFDGARFELRAMEITGQGERRLLQASGRAEWQRFSIDGRLLVVATSTDLELWDVASASRIDSLKVSAKYGSFDPLSGRIVVIIDDRPLLCSLAQETGSRAGRFLPLISLPLPKGMKTTMATLSSGSSRALIYPGRSALVVVGLDGTGARVLPGLHHDLWQATESPDGRFIVTSTWNGHDLMLWDMNGTQAPTVLRGSEGLARATVNFTPDGHWLIAGFPTQYMQWRVPEWEPGPTIARSPLLGLAAPASITADGRTLLGSHDDDGATLYALPGGEKLATFPVLNRASLAALAISPNGRSIAVATKGGVIELWDVPLARAELAKLGLDWQEP